MRNVSLLIWLIALCLPALPAYAVDSVRLYTPEQPPNIDMNEARKGARQFALPPCITCPDVAQIQRELTRLGYQAGPIDGIVGPITRRAIRAFQQDQSLRTDGEATDTLLSRLKAL